jgi:hypothetical protein
LKQKNRPQLRPIGVVFVEVFGFLVAACHIFVKNYMQFSPSLFFKIIDLSNANSKTRILVPETGLEPAPRN